jgi:hypothetical protein
MYTEELGREQEINTREEEEKEIWRKEGNPKERVAEENNMEEEKERVLSSVHKEQW